MKLLYAAFISSLYFVTTLQAGEINEKIEISYYDKPASLTALEWVQCLENERDLAEINSNFEIFKRATNEISATIGGKYGISERRATQEEEIILIHSIIRTRHKFINQRNIIYDRYLNYDLPHSYHLLAKDLFNNHMAAVLAIDSLVKKSLEDEIFHETWNQIDRRNSLPQKFGEEIIKEVKTFEKCKVFNVLIQSLANFFHNQVKTVCLANEIFNLFAPKLTVEKIYSDVMVSGGIYKGWQVHNLDAFAYPLNLTESEKRSNPGLESRLREKFLKNLTRYPNDIFPTSQKAVNSSNELRTKFNLASQEGLIEYIYDNCLIHRNGYGVQGEGPRRFYLSRPLSPHLSLLIKPVSGVIPSSTILKTYQYIVLHSEGRSTGKMKERMKKWGIPYDDGSSFINTKADERNEEEIERLKEAATLGYLTAIKCLPLALNEYAKNLFKGENKIKRDIPKAIKVMKEALVLGDKTAKSNLIYFYTEYSAWLFHGTQGVTRDISKAIKMTKKAIKIGNEDTNKKVAGLFNNYAVTLFEGSNGVERNIPQSFEILKEAVKLGNSVARTNYHILCNRYALILFEGDQGIEKNPLEAIKLLRRAVLLGNEGAKSNYMIKLKDYALMLLKGSAGVETNPAQAIRLLKKIAAIGTNAVKNNIAIDLNNYALTLVEDEEGIKKNSFKAIKILRVASSLGNEIAKKNLEIQLNNHALNLFDGNNRLEEDCCFEAVDFMQEALNIGSEYAQKNLDAFSQEYSLKFFQANI